MRALIAIAIVGIVLAIIAGSFGADTLQQIGVAAFLISVAVLAVYALLQRPVSLEDFLVSDRNDRGSVSRREK
jgi:drug/metabolite transporter (DMT)-like permease